MLFAFCRLLLRFGLRLALALVSCYRLRLCPPRPCSSPPGLCLVRPPRRPPSCKTSRTFLGTSSQSVPVYISLNYNISYKFSTATGIDIGKNMAGTYLEPAFAPDKGTPQAKLVEPGSARSAVDLTQMALTLVQGPLTA